jgi:DSBA-like thioredoxin domain
MNSGFLFYGDLNCPFCYAQNERLLDLNAYPGVEWRGVRHAPAIPIPSSRPPSQPERDELVREVGQVRQREPSLRLILPSARPNSEPGTLLVAAAIRVDAARAATLRNLLYRALWAHGRDISDASVLDELRREAELPRLTITSIERRVAEAWQHEWEAGDFDRRIPTMVSPRGAHLIGLSERRRVETFLKSGVFSSESDDACR